MNCAQIIIKDFGEGASCIIVDGRGNFEAAVPMREFVNSLPSSFREVFVDLEKCDGMDSTFMGVLSMLGLKARKCGAKIAVVNASESNRNLLKGLGVAKLFQFTENKQNSSGGKELTVQKDMLSTAETVLEAHKTLVEADETNQEKFKQVIDFAQNDVDRLKK